MMTYDPSILTSAPRAFRTQLDLSARMDGHRGHSMLSLAVELGVYPDRVLDAVQGMQAQVCLQEPGATPTEITAAVYVEHRYAGTIELPEGHPGGGGYLADCYLTDDAVVFVLEAIRPPSFVYGSPAVAVPA